MADVRLAHTSLLRPAALAELRSFLVEAFDGRFDGEDWEHTLGGMHVLVLDGNELLAHGAVVQRRLLHAGRALRAGYVEGVAVRADRRRLGHGRTVMRRLDPVIRGAYELGALSAGEPAAALYRELGWKRWQGRTWALGPNGLERTPEDDDSTYVLPVDAELDVDADLTCDWREGDVW